jgi:DNA primase
MGSTLSRHQADLLAIHFDRAMLMLDGDEAGRHGATTIAHSLEPRIHLTVVRLGDGVQPDQQSAEDLQCLIGSHIDAPTT